MDNNDKFKKEAFVATVCSVCGLCKDPNPRFCMSLYDTDGSRFTNEIVLRVKLLKETDFRTFLELRSFGGFTALFCHPNRCPLYEEDCASMLSARVVCFQEFLKQVNECYGLDQLHDVYKEWSGIELWQIREKFDVIEDISKVSLSKKQSKRIRKSIKKAKRRLSNSDGHKKSKRKEVETLLFYNSNEEWKEKISGYLEKNGQPQDHNRQPSEAHKCVRQSN